MINPRAGQWALSRVVQEFSPLNPASGIFLTAARYQGLADTVDCYYSPLAPSNTDYAIGFALVRMAGNIGTPDADTVLLPGLDTTLRDLRNPERNALRSFLAANLGDYSYRDWAGVVRNKLAFGDKGYILDTPIRQIVTDVFDFLEHGNPFNITGEPEAHNTEYTDDFSTDPYSAPRWVNHGETINWDSTNNELDVAHAGAAVLERYSANNSGSIDHEAQVTCYSQTSPSEQRVTGAAVRMYGTNPDAYCIYGDNSTDNLYFGRFNSGTLTEISSTSYTFGAGFYTFCLAAEVSGTDDVALSGWIQSEGASKPSDPGWITNVGSETHTYTDTSANRLNNASNHTDCGIGSQYAISRDYDTQLCYFKLRAVSDRGGGTTYNESMSLGLSAGLSESAAATFASSISLGVGAGISDAGTAEMGNAISIGVAHGIAESGGLLLSGDITAGVSAGVSAIDALTLSGALSLSISHSTAAESLAVFAGNITLGAQLALAADAAATYTGTLTLGVQSGIGAEGAIESNTYSVSISLGLAHGTSAQSQADYAAQMQMGVQAGITGASVATLNDAVTLGMAIGHAIAGVVGQPITPASRTLTFRAEGRTLTVTVEDRTITVKAENRTLQ